MFKKIFLSPLSVYLFIIGYILFFFIMIFQNRILASSLFTALIGGLIFVGIWGFILKTLQFLLTEQELSVYFRIPLDHPNTNTYTIDTDNDDDPLTIDELYGSSNDIDENTDAIESSSLTDHLESDSELNSDSFSQNTPQKPIQETTIANDGKFNLTVAGKTLRTTPEDGAKAIKKTLIDDE